MLAVCFVLHRRRGRRWLLPRLTRHRDAPRGPARWPRLAGAAVRRESTVSPVRREPPVRWEPCTDTGAAPNRREPSSTLRGLHDGRFLCVAYSPDFYMDMDAFRVRCSVRLHKERIAQRKDIENYHERILYRRNDIHAVFQTTMPASPGSP